MAIPSSKKEGSGKEWEKVPEGTHIARCVTVVDLGLQETPWGDKEQVHLGFEIPGFRVEWEKDDEKHEGPGLIGVTWTNNLYEEANLGMNLISWRGRKFTEEEEAMFDLSNLLGVPCMLSVAHNTAKNGKTYANVASIVGVPSGVPVPDQERESIGYSAKDPATASNLEKLPEWMRNIIAKAKAVADEPQPQDDGDDDFDDDIPF